MKFMYTDNTWYLDQIKYIGIDEKINELIREEEFPFDRV